MLYARTHLSFRKQTLAPDNRFDKKEIAAAAYVLCLLVPEIVHKRVRLSLLGPTAYACYARPT